MSIGEIILAQEHPSIRRKMSSSATFSITNRTWKNMELNPNFPGERPAANHLRYAADRLAIVR
jgi:hypothetical protein